MKIYHEEIPEITRYINMYQDSTIVEHISTYDTLFENIKNFKIVTPDSEILEIGVGMGWFLIYCHSKGLRCRGIEISPQLATSAKDVARRHGLEADISLGNIEDCSVGAEEYDIIIAHSVFEHVEDWKSGILNVYRALKPGGLFYFVSTNKFSLKSGEYNFPLYGWLPDQWRYGLRRWRQGEQIMRLGIDFNQFTHPQLRRYFMDVGFNHIIDIAGIKNISNVRNSSAVKRHALLAAKKSNLLKNIILTFSPVTTFICIK